MLLYFFAFLFNIFQHILQFLRVLCQESKAFFQVASPVLPTDILEPIKPLQNLLKLSPNSLLFFQFCSQCLPSRRLGPVLLLQLIDLILQRLELLFAVGVLLMDLVLGKKHVLRDVQHQLQEHFFHFTEEFIKVLLHEEKKFLGAFPDLEGADFTVGKPIQLLQDYALYHQHHFEEVVLERDVDAQHARLGGEAKELRFVGHGIDRHGGG